MDFISKHFIVYGFHRADIREYAEILEKSKVRKFPFNFFLNLCEFINCNVVFK